MPGGPEVTVRAKTKDAAKHGAAIMGHMPLQAPWPRCSGPHDPHCADGKHWTREVFHVNGESVVVRVRLFPGPENPVAKLKGHGRDFTFASEPYA
jgi:hypothetical protein